MAYTSTPDKDAQKTQRIRFDGKDAFRYGDLSAARDLQIVNMYYDIVSDLGQQQDIWCKKRPGISAAAYTLSKTTNTDPVRGFHYDADQNALFWCVNNNIYRLKPDVSSTPTNILTLTTSSGEVGFCSYIKSDNTKYIVITDGVKLYLHDVTGVIAVEVVDADLPTPHVPTPIYLNGYIFLAKSGTGDIYNSNVDNPSSWTAGDFISVEMSSDNIIRLARSKNYIIAFGTNSIEYFYDAGVATGSPIQRQDSGYNSIGYVTGFRDIGDSLFFVGQEAGQNINVYTINGFKIQPVATEVVKRTLQTTVSTDNTKSNIILNRSGYSISVDGKTFYALVTAQTTWIFDFANNIWYEWKNSSDAALNIEAAWQMYNGITYLAITNQSTISKMSPSIYQDFGTNFTAKYVTDRLDFNTWNTKMMSNALFYCDQYLATGTSNLAVSWSDNDAGTYSTPRNTNLFTPRPILHQLGSFRTRVFKLEYADNYPWRIRGLEFNINIGRS